MLQVFSTILEAIDKIFYLLGYVSNDQSYPQPLTPEEEAKYLAMYRNGNEDAKNVLIERNLRLVANIVNKKYNSNKNENEDLCSVGSIGLIKAIKTFDSSRDTKLSTYAARCIENEILMYLRKNARAKNEISLEEPINTDKDGNETSLMNLISTDGDTVIDEVEHNLKVKWLYKKISTILKKNEIEVLKARYGLYNEDEKTQQQIADKLGISRSYVSRIESKAIKKLSRHSNKDFFN